MAGQTNQLCLLVLCNFLGNISESKGQRQGLSHPGPSRIAPADPSKPGLSAPPWAQRAWISSPTLSLPEGLRSQRRLKRLFLAPSVSTSPCPSSPSSSSLSLSWSDGSGSGVLVTLEGLRLHPGIFLGVGVGSSAGAALSKAASKRACSFAFACKTAMI